MLYTVIHFTDRSYLSFKPLPLSLEAQLPPLSLKLIPSPLPESKTQTLSPLPLKLMSLPLSPNSKPETQPTPPSPLTDLTDRDCTVI